MRRRALVIVVLSLAVASAKASTLKPQNRTTVATPLKGDKLSHLLRNIERSSRHFHNEQTVSGLSKPATVAIDGSKNPELISDHLAYRHFLEATALPVDASSSEVSRREALLKLAGLSPADRAVYVQALGDFRAELTSIITAARDSNISPKDFQSLKLQADLVIDNTRSRLMTALSPAARTRLDEHIRTHVKRRIVVYEGPKQ